MNLNIKVIFQLIFYYKRNNIIQMEKKFNIEAPKQLINCKEYEL